MAKESTFINLGSVKASKNLSKDLVKELRSSGLGMNIKLYMPKTTLRVGNEAVIDFRFGTREKDADFVVGHASIYLGNLAMKKGTSKNDISDLRDIGKDRDFEYDLRLSIFLGKDNKDDLELRDGDLIHVNFKPHKDSPDFVVGSASLIEG
jgi:hypothetical protein